MRSGGTQGLVGAFFPAISNKQNSQPVLRKPVKAIFYLYCPKIGESTVCPGLQLYEFLPSAFEARG